VLNFALGPVPVRIHWSALLLALFAWYGGFRGAEIAVFTVVAILSVLIHELGHAFTARLYRGEAMVTLYALGGVTKMVPTNPFTTGQRFVMAAAGSAIEIVVALGVWALARTGAIGPTAEEVAESPFGEMVGRAAFSGDLLALGVAIFIWVSVVWGLFNWVPIRGLDGHQMLGRLLELTMPERRAATVLRVISIVVGIGVAVFAWRAGQLFVAIFVVMLTFSDLFGRSVGSMAGR
jgi:stage IV sporulation protein FB